jgi:hypothetical protein
MSLRVPRPFPTGVCPRHFPPDRFFSRLFSRAREISPFNVQALLTVVLPMSLGCLGTVYTQGDHVFDSSLTAMSQFMPPHFIDSRSLELWTPPRSATQRTQQSYRILLPHAFMIFDCDTANSADCRNQPMR